MVYSLTKLQVILQPTSSLLHVQISPRIVALHRDRAFRGFNLNRKLVDQKITASAIRNKFPAHLSHLGANAGARERRFRCNFRVGAAQPGVQCLLWRGPKGQVWHCGGQARDATVSLTAFERRAVSVNSKRYFGCICFDESCVRRALFLALFEGQRKKGEIGLVQNFFSYLTLVFLNFFEF